MGAMCSNVAAGKGVRFHDVFVANSNSLRDLTKQVWLLPSLSLTFLRPAMKAGLPPHPS